MNELLKARVEEDRLRTELNAARAATDRGAPMYIEAQAQGRWQSAYCRVRELEQSYTDD